MSRLNWADSLKGVLIVLVVLGHSIQETLKGGCADNHLWNYIYSFHMPAFMAVSGFLSYRGDGGANSQAINNFLKISTANNTFFTLVCNKSSNSSTLFNKCFYKYILISRQLFLVSLGFVFHCGVFPAR